MNVHQRLLIKSKNKSYEQNYPVHDLELAYVVFVLEIWRHYLFGKRCEIHMNHKSLKYFFTENELNIRHRSFIIRGRLM
jgi:hypothetical protein